jgi:tetratricopeptide (TPR) repeat protein
LVAVEGPQGLVLRLRQHAAAPLDYLLTYFVLLGGKQEFWLRFPATLWSLLTLPALYVFGRRAAGWPAALGAVALLAISPFAVRYAQELRPYAAFGFWSVLSSYLLLRAVQTDRRSCWLGYLATATLNLHTHLFALAAVAAQLGWLAALALLSLPLRRRQGLAEGWAWRWPRERWFWAGAALLSLAALALYSPWLPDYILPVATKWLETIYLGNAPGVQPTSALETARSALPALSQELWSETLATFGAGQGQPVNWAYALLASVGTLALVRRRPASALLAALLLLGSVLVVALLLSRQALFGPRYLIFAHPIYLLMASVGVVAVGQGVGWLRRRLTTAPSFAAAISLLLALVLLAATLPGLRAHYAWQREDWRGLAQALAVVMQPEDTFANPGGLGQYVGFYWPELRASRQSPATTAAEIMALPDPGIWLLRTRYNRSEFDEALYGWLTAQKAAALAFTPDMTLYLATPGQDALALLQQRIQAHGIEAEPRWRALLAGAFADRARLEAAAVNPAAAAAHLAAAAHYDESSLDWSIYVETGNAYRQAGDHETAVRFYQQALGLSLDEPAALNPLGLSLLNLGRSSEAETALRAAIAADGNSFWGRYLLGEALVAQGRLTEALVAYQAAQVIDPAHPFPYQKIGDVLLAQGQAEAAGQSYRQGLAAAPDDANLLHGLALAEEMAGAREMALAVWQRYLAVAPEGAFAAEAAAAIERLSGPPNE